MCSHIITFRSLQSLPHLLSSPRLSRGSTCLCQTSLANPLHLKCRHLLATDQGQDWRGSTTAAYLGTARQDRCVSSPGSWSSTRASEGPQSCAEQTPPQAGTQCGVWSPGLGCWWPWSTQPCPTSLTWLDRQQHDQGVLENSHRWLRKGKQSKTISFL